MLQGLKIWGRVVGDKNQGEGVSSKGGAKIWGLMPPPAPMHPTSLASVPQNKVSTTNKELHLIYGLQLPNEG